MKWIRRRTTDEALHEQLALAQEKLRETKSRDPKVNRIADRLRKHYEDNQFATRIVQHLAEGR